MTTANISTDAFEAAQTLWEYMHMGHEPCAADCIIAGGSHDTRVAARAAELYLAGLAPIVVMTGGLGRHTEGTGHLPEAKRYAAVARDMGVPDDVILKEKRSTNTGENAIFTRELLASQGIRVGSILIAHKPYMERRAYATFRQQWPDVNVQVTSQQVRFEDYGTDEIALDEVIHIMVGDFQRLPIYAEKGFQIHQDITPGAQTAYERLVRLGYTREMIGGGEKNSCESAGVGILPRA